MNGITTWAAWRVSAVMPGNRTSRRFHAFWEAPRARAQQGEELCENLEHRQVGAAIEE